MEKYIQSVFFDYFLREYAPELMDQKTIRNTINAFLKNNLVIDAINAEYPAADITTKTFSIKKSKENKKKDSVAAATPTNTQEDTFSVSTLHKMQDYFAMGGGGEDESVRVQIVHWYMFLNFYFLKVAIEKPFIKSPRPSPFSLIYTSEPYQHPVTSNEYLESALAEYGAIFGDIRQLLTIDVLRTDINENIMQAVFKTPGFQSVVRKIKGGTRYERRGQTVKYRRSTRHRKKHRRTTAKWRPRYTSKKRPTENKRKKTYTMKRA